MAAKQDSLTFAEFLRANLEKIVADWMRAVRARLPAARHADKLALEDNVPGMLERIAASLANGGERLGSSVEAVNPLDDLSQLHASERLLLGYDVGQVVDEYRLLRRTVLQLFADVAPPGGPRQIRALSFFDECIDLAVTSAVERFSRERQRIIERWQLAAEAADVGLWDLDLGTKEVVADARCKALFGLSAEARTDFNALRDAIHPDDLPLVDQGLRAALDPNSDDDFRAEYRVKGIGDGVERWIIARGRVTERDAAGAPRRLMGTVLDSGDRKRAERERELFVAAIGHDLRNPLATIKALADRTARVGDDATGAAARIASTANRMARMLDELLDFSRSQLGDLPLDRDEVDLREVFAEVADEIVHQHPNLKVPVSAVGATTGYWDRARLTHVAQNLLMNAVRHGDTSRPITVELRGQGDVLTFSVHNHGSPIDRALLATLFEPFRRARIGGEGLGLGLYIVKEVLEAHGGEIAVHSDAASGTAFSALLPRRPRS